MPVPAVRGGISVPFEIQPMVKSAPQSSNLLFMLSPLNSEPCEEEKTQSRAGQRRGRGPSYVGGPRGALRPVVGRGRCFRRARSAPIRSSGEVLRAEDDSRPGGHRAGAEERITPVSALAARRLPRPGRG